MKRVIVQQPSFLPWAGTLHKAVSADVYIIYCGVKFDQSSYQHRVKLNGSWMTLPIEKNQRTALIKDVRLADNYCYDLSDMAKRIQQTCMTKRHKHRERLEGIVHDLHGWRSPWMFELVNALYLDMLEILGIKTEIRIDIIERPQLAKIEKLDVCLKDHMWDRGPFIYLSGTGAKEYMSFDSLQTPAETRFQSINDDVSMDSALQLIASHDEPVSAIQRCAHWLDKHGGRHEWNS